MLLVARGSGALRRLCADRMRASRDIDNDILGVFICRRRRTVRVCEWLCYVCEKDMSILVSFLLAYVRPAPSSHRPLLPPPSPPRAPPLTAVADTPAGQRRVARARE